MERLNDRLGPATLSSLPSSVRRPAYDRAALRPGVLHLGPGAFHRAHLAVFTEDAIEAVGGAWGVVGVSLRSPAARRDLTPQAGLYAVETLGEGVRVIGALRGVIFAPEASRTVIAAFSDPAISIVTLTVTEAGYDLGPDGRLDISRPDIAADLTDPAAPLSAIGWLTRGLAERRRVDAGPITVMSCDNLADNGGRLAAAVVAFAERRDSTLARWVETHVAFPSSVVDCLVPAPDPAHRARVAAAMGLDDQASVQREPFAAWAIEDRFAGPRPAWEAVGAELVASVESHQRLKLHGLNAIHSALAYAGLTRGFCFVRQAIADPDLAALADALISREIAPALEDLDVAGYWARTRARFANPALDHRLSQIAADGSVKLAQRIYPILIANARAGRPTAGLAGVVRAWLATASEGSVRDPQALRLAAWRAAGSDMAAALDDDALFPSPFRGEPAVRAAMLAGAG